MKIATLVLSSVVALSATAAFAEGTHEAAKATEVQQPVVDAKAEKAPAKAAKMDKKAKKEAKKTEEAKH